MRCTLQLLIPRILLGVCFALVAACSGGGSGRNAPGVVSFPVAVISGDTTPPFVSSVTPADLARQVNVINPTVKVTFSEAIDPATINQATVAFYYVTLPDYGPLPDFITLSAPSALGGAGDLAPKHIAYDGATNTLTISPIGNLGTNRRYFLVLSGIKDISKNVMADTSFSFTTYKNTPLKIVFYTPPPTTSSNVIQSYAYFSHDSNLQHISRKINYVTPGTDRNWDTLDDNDLSSYTNYAYDGSNNLTKGETYIAIGPNLKWDIPPYNNSGWIDDVIGSNVNNTYDTMGVLSSIDGHIGSNSNQTTGGTTAACSGTSTSSSTATSSTTSSGGNTNQSQNTNANTSQVNGCNTAATGNYEFHQLICTAKSTLPQCLKMGLRARDIAWISNASPGADNLWYTSDDLIDRHQKLFYDGTTNQAYLVEYISPGPDNKWFTGDDDISYYYLSNYDGNGTLLRKDHYIPPIGNSQPFSGNDRLQDYTKYGYDSQGNPTIEINYANAGPDGKWFNSDDLVGSYIQNLIQTVTSNYNLMGTLRQIVYSDKGPDAKWFTADDVISKYSDTCTINGIKTGTFTYNAPGTGGWSASGLSNLAGVCNTMGNPVPTSDQRESDSTYETVY